MLVNFIGSPASGKTTTAASVFARLKETGTPTEFIAEYARQWIARKRLDNPGQVIALGDEDHYRIMLKQFMLEKIMTDGNGDAVVVADSCPLLSILYMTDGRIHKYDVEELARKTAERLDVVFYCPPLLHSSVSRDVNRVHSYEQAIELDSKLPALFKKYAPNAEIHMLDGTNETRTNEALSTIFARKLR